MALSIGNHHVMAELTNESSPYSESMQFHADTTAIVICITIYDTSASDGVVSKVIHKDDDYSAIVVTQYYDSLCDGHVSIWYLNGPLVDQSYILGIYLGGTVTDIKASVTEIYGGEIQEESVGTPATGTTGDPTITWTAAGDFSFACMLDDQTDATKVHAQGTEIYTTDVGDVVAAQYDTGATASMSWVDDDGDEDWVVVGCAFEEYIAGIQVYKDIQVKWDIAELVTKSIEAKWDMFELIGDNLQIKWDIFDLAGNSLQSKWDILNLVGQEVQAKYDIRELVYKDIQMVWDILSDLAQVFKDMQIKWDIRELVNKDTVIKWDILNLVGQELQAKWDILVLVGKSLQGKWDILNLITKSIEIKWDILNLVTKSIEAVWDMYMYVNKSIQMKWDILNGAPPADEGGKRSLRQMAYRWTSRMGR